MGEKVLINLATGMEDGERVLVGFLVATAAQAQGKEVVVWATKEAVRPVCVRSASTPAILGEAETVAYTKVAGATPMWERAGSDATVLSY